MSGSARFSGLGIFVALSCLGVIAAIFFASELALLVAPVHAMALALYLWSRASGDAERPKLGQTYGKNSYEVLDKLGEGGMGEVFRARQLRLNRMVALKRIKPLQSSSEERARFKREARVLSSLFNPHTINVFDAGVQPDGSFFYVMELLDGIDLERIVSQQGALEAARVIHILRQATMSLAEAHRHGLVHRDLKPANLMVCRYGGEYDFVKVLDFGLVKVALSDADADHKITQDSEMPGTPAFMAPEMALGSSFVDARTDLYSLGAIAHYLLTGRFLFEATSPMAMVNAQLREFPARASKTSPHEVPDLLDQLVDRCLEKEPDDRFQSAEELLAELERLALVHPWTRDAAASAWRQIPPASDAPKPHLPSDLPPDDFFLPQPASNGAKSA